MNDYLDLFKKIWSNKRYRAIIIMSLYIIFFTVVLLFVKFAPRNNEVNYLETFKNKKTYRFQINYLDKTVVGEYRNGDMYLTDGEKLFEYKNNTLNDDSFEAKDVLMYIDHDKILEIMDKNEVYSETKYKDGTKSKTYQLDNTDIIIHEKYEIFGFDIKINDIEYKILYN